MDPQQRREHILIKAAELFGEHGYHATSITSIIQSAGIARGTFYLYFENKKAIFSELIDQLVVRIRNRIQIVDISKGAPSAREQLLDNIVSILELLTENKPLLSLMLEGAVGLDREFGDKLSSFYYQTAGFIESSLCLGLQMKLVRPCNTRIASLAVIGALKEVLHDLLRGNEDTSDIPYMANEVLDLFTKGVLAPGMTIP